MIVAVWPKVVSMKFTTTSHPAPGQNDTNMIEELSSAEGSEHDEIEYI